MLLFTNIESIRRLQQWEENNCRIVNSGTKIFIGFPAQSKLLINGFWTSKWIFKQCDSLKLSEQWCKRDKDQELSPGHA